MTQYQNYWLPNNGRIFACLRVKKQLVALPHQRTAGEDGEEYNVDRGNQTEVLAREAHYHHYLDEAGLRWQKDRNNELFQPTKGPLQIVESLRRVKGLQLLLFDEDDWREDTLYDGGDVKEPQNLQVRDTNQRKTPARSSTDPSISEDESLTWNWDFVNDVADEMDDEEPPSFAEIYWEFVDEDGRFDPLRFM